jgi:hypothetical protein
LARPRQNIDLAGCCRERTCPEIAVTPCAQYGSAPNGPRAGAIDHGREIPAGAPISKDTMAPFRRIPMTQRIDSRSLSGRQAASFHAP